ncbi:MAG: 50S ribosomal protein L6 [Methanothrix sp.]|uniref:50S ribosomal protein L6 n=1 Tax=Methanothrix sp. TaxID=90426 RepID=UPI0032AFAE12|nr:50S ribosomal protein L6 [Methanothrix sp.]
MVKEVVRRLDIPDGVDVQISGRDVKVRGPKGELSRELWYPGIEIKREDSEILIRSEVTKKQHLAMVGTIAAHINNMIKGVTDGFEYRMKVVYSHFPIQVKVADGKVVISNFLGERKPRFATIIGDSKVEVGKDEIVIRGTDREAVGQTMANIEQATRVRGFDVRIFQDGIYLVEKR